MAAAQISRPCCWPLAIPFRYVRVRASARYFKELPDLAETRNVPNWLSRNLSSLAGTVIRMPERAEIDANLGEQLIVEYYSR